MPAEIHRVVELEPTLAAPAEARRFIRSALGDEVDRETIELAELLTSELVDQRDPARLRPRQRGAAEPSRHRCGQRE